MTETTHTRSRRASLGGLLCQLLVFAAALVLSYVVNSVAVNYLAWYLLGGVPIWFVALLFFRQQELAALEALDLEELRRERQTVGGEALFAEEATGAAGFRVAENRLRWMQRWLVPGFGLGTAVYLAIMGTYLWWNLAVTKVVAGVTVPGRTISGGGWSEMRNVPLGMVTLAILMLATFLFSRYTSGMGRVREWQLLRACGSYMLGNALVLLALFVCLGVQQYAGVASGEHALAFIIPALMVVLALETLINFVLDIYRPRAPGIEPRACFDSRLLGLFAEPGGIASSIADAINYQFGFQVSHTWFYQLLERTFVPLVAAGALALWLLTCIVVVQPYEHVIVTRFGRQLNAQQPWPPGLHFKAPYPIDVAHAYNTGQLLQIDVGYERVEAVPDYDKAAAVQLWTDDKHMGQEHFNFLICPTARTADLPELPATAPAAEPSGAAESKDTPVHVIRLHATIQYRLRPDALDRYTQTMVSRHPETALREMAWEETTRYLSSTTVDELLGARLGQVGELLRQRIGPRAAALGLEVVYVGVTNVHPERTVAEAFRGVVKAEQEKVAAIREALVTENERLSKVAGDAVTARALANAVERARKASEALNDALQTLHAADARTVDELTRQLEQSESVFQAHISAQARLERARDAQLDAELNFELGLGETAAERNRVARAVAAAQADERAAADALAAALAPWRTAAAQRLGPALAEALIRSEQARLTRAYWERELELSFTPSRLEGEAAAKLAEALADRWTIEMSAAKELTQALNERQAYQAAPQIYKTRRLIDVLVNGLKDARKFFVAFDPGQRDVRVRFLVDDDIRLSPIDIAPERKR